jgi:hypothetical protein
LLHGFIVLLFEGIQLDSPFDSAYAIDEPLSKPHGVEARLSSPAMHKVREPIYFCKKKREWKIGLEHRAMDCSRIFTYSE